MDLAAAIGTLIFFLDFLHTLILVSANTHARYTHGLVTSKEADR